MTSFLKSALAAVAFVLGAAAAHAQGQVAMPPLPNPPAASVAIAKDILAAKQVSSLYQNAVPSITGQVRDSYLKDNLDKQKDLTEVAAKVTADLKGRENEIGDIMAKVYASNFTEQELKDISAFYKSPLGKKVLENEPKMIESSVGYFQEWTGKFEDEVVQRFKAEMKKRGKDI